MSDISAEAAAQEIGDLIRGVYQAFADGSPERIEEALAADCTVWDVFTPELIRGREERARFHAADQAQKQTRGRLGWSLSSPLVQVWGDTAVARYVLDFEYLPPRPFTGRVRVTDVLRRHPDGWRIVHHHEGLVPTGPP